ncbi:hypothetical protein WJX72_008663 [[Myrmecia] bisecta]|uniref:EamA domain-containing protein n=1 Tax=[Myrmecia] bisecta TaxID=41462 RepID=A0AAW1QSU6_9CHLO
MPFQLPATTGTEEQETAEGLESDMDYKGHPTDPDSQHNSGGLLPVVSGQLCLTFVALLWGSYSPALRFLYAMDGPPNPASSPSKFKGPLAPLRNWMQSSSDSIVIAGLEMGLWNFGAAVFQAVGLEHTTATRSAFLIQATALLTPLLATLGGERPTRNVWIGCCIALMGTLLITADKHGAPDGEQAASMLSGDLAIFAAAFFFSMATVRLGRYTPYFQSVTLASAKSTAMALFSLGWLGVAAVGQVAEAAQLSDMWRSAGNPQAWGAVSWAAIGPGALAAFLQTKGQTTVPAAQSQVIYSSMPLWSALFAYLLLSGETMGPSGWVGGAAIVTAGLVASRK